MIPGALDLAFTRGDTFAQPFTFVDDTTGVVLNWSGKTFAAQLRLYEDAPEFVAFTVDGANLATGVLVISLTPVQTAQLGRSYAWDLQRTDPDGTVLTVLAGLATAKLDVTR